jgi:hypothetical protein
MSEAQPDPLTPADAARRAGGAPTAELLDAVRAEGGRRRRTRQRRRTGALVLAAVVLVAVPVAALSAGDGGGRDDELVAASNAEPADHDGDDAAGAGDFADERRERLTPTSAAAPTTVVALPLAPPAPATTATTATTPPADDTDAPDPTPTTSAPSPRPTTPPTAAPPPAPVCRNSTDPACGPFRYDPVPANAPLVLSATARTATVAVGEEVVVDVTWSDADAGVVFSSGADWTGGGGVGAAFFCSRVELRYGPWDPPPPAGASGTYTAVHTYDEPGTYSPTFTAISARSSDPDCQDPFISEAFTGVTITVTG